MAVRGCTSNAGGRYRFEGLLPHRRYAVAIEEQSRSTWRYGQAISDGAAAKQTFGTTEYAFPKELKRPLWYFAEFMPQSGRSVDFAVAFANSE